MPSGDCAAQFWSAFFLVVFYHSCPVSNDWFRRCHAFEPPIGESYGATETANGELGFYLVSDGKNAPYRARCRPPSFINYQCFPELVRGHRVSDVIAILSGMNVIAAELDR